MTVNAKVLIGALTADATPSSFTSSGFGVAEAAIVFVTHANTTGNPVGNGAVSVGIWDGTRQYSMALATSAGSATTRTARYRNSNRIAVIKTWDGTSHTTAAEYTLTQVTDGVELALSEDGTSLARYATVILLKGLKNKRVGTFAFAGNTSAVDVTDPGFKPSLVFYVQAGSAADYSTTDEENAVGYITIGVAHCSSGNVITQHSVGYASTDAVATSKANSSTNDDCIGRILYNDTSIDRKETISAFDASGFSVTPSAATSSRPMYLAIELNDPDEAFVGIIDSKVSTGTQAYTGVGFPPVVLGLLSTTETATNQSSTTPGGALLLGATDGTTQQALSIGQDDAASSATSFSTAVTNNVLLLNFDTSGSWDALAAYDSFDADGFTLNYSDGSASAKKVVAWAIGADAAAAATLDVTAGAYTLTGQSVGLNAGRALSVTPGSYALTGADVGLSLGRALSVTAGAYAITGQDVDLAAGRSLAVTPGAYALTGQSVGLGAARILSVTPGSYALTGNAVELTYAQLGSYSIDVTPGAYAIAGSAVGLAAARALAVTPGAYSITGADVDFSSGLSLDVTPGSYAVTGQDVSLARALRLSVTTGVYALTGNQVVLTYSGTPVPVIRHTIIASSASRAIIGRSVPRTIIAE